MKEPHLVQPLAEISEARYKRKERQLATMYELDERATTIATQLPSRAYSDPDVRDLVSNFKYLHQTWSRFVSKELGITESEWLAFRARREGSADQTAVGVTRE